MLRGAPASRPGPAVVRWPRWRPSCRPGWSTGPARSTATRWCGSTEPSPSRARARSGCACGSAACAGPISTSPRATCSPRRPRVTPGHEVVGVVDQLGPGSTRWRVGDRVGVPWLAHTCGDVPLLPVGPREPVPRAALHRLGRRRRLRRVRRGRRGLRLRAARGLRRRGGGAAPLRRDHRLPGPAAGQPPRRGPARHLRLRRLGPSHGPGRAGPRRPRPRHDPLRPRRSSSRSSSAPASAGEADAPPPEPLDSAILFAPVGIARAARPGRPGPGRDAGHRRHLPERHPGPRLPDAPLRGADACGA